MKKYLLVLIIISAYFNGNSQNQLLNLPPKLYIVRTFLIENENGQATCFIGIYKEKYYLITAKHLFKPSDKIINFKVLANGSRKQQVGEVFFHSDSSVDIAVIKTPMVNNAQNAINLQVNPNDGAGYGESGFFLGFPHGLYSDDNGLNKGSPLPLVKRAVFSGAVKLKGFTYLMFDGFNNPGFSGGPIIFKDYSDSTGYKWYLFGVVKGFYPEVNSVTDSSGNKNNSLRVTENSGIIAGTHAKYIAEIIDNIK